MYRAHIDLPPSGADLPAQADRLATRVYDSFLVQSAMIHTNSTDLPKAMDAFGKQLATERATVIEFTTAVSAHTTDTNLDHAIENYIQSYK